MNAVQRLALISVISRENEKEEADKLSAFKTAALAANLEHASKVLDMFEQIENERAGAGFSNGEEMTELTVEDKQYMLGELRSLGLSD